MAVVPGFKHDVFVSYAHFDNEPDTQEIRWVSRFQADLETALRQRLGVEPEIFFDFSRNLQAHSELSILTENAQRSAIFLAIFSPSYVKREWTIRELEAFDQVATARNRIVTVELLPIKEGDYPPRFRQLKHAPFWWKDEREEDIAFKVTPKSNGDKYDRRLQTLAHQMEELMVELQAGAAQKQAPQSTGVPAPAAQPPDAQPGLSSKTVLLAQATNDLYDERDQVLAYLKQYGVKVLPEGDYMQGGAEFAKAVKGDLERANYFIQLLGPYRSHRPPDLKDDPADPESKSYAQFQYDNAVQRGLPILQWRRPDLDLASVSHWDKALLEGPKVLAMGLQEFLKEIKKTIERDITAADHKAAPKTDFLFIDADSSDQDLTDRLLKAFENRQDWMAAGPLLEGTAEEINKDLDANLIECGALMLVYGNASVPWIRAQLRRYSKLERHREEPPRFKGILFAPPGQKPEISWSGGFTRIECPSGLTGHDIERIMAELRR